MIPLPGPGNVPFEASYIAGEESYMMFQLDSLESITHIGERGTLYGVATLIKGESHAQNQVDVLHGEPMMDLLIH